ncbi:MAG: Dabb family protein [Isosphaeraceae bacterium]|nr:Dabb family protein [Isosphaeraceae bacterium]
MSMRSWLGAGLAAVTMLTAAAAVSRSNTSAEPKLAHMVFFELKDRSKESREKFAASCEKYLSGHEGVEHFSVGLIAEDVVEPNVSVRDFDVSLHLIFENKAAEAKYLKAERHTKFVEENRANFAKVRVFDTYLISR